VYQAAGIAGRCAFARVSRQGAGSRRILKPPERGAGALRPEGALVRARRGYRRVGRSRNPKCPKSSRFSDVECRTRRRLRDLQDNSIGQKPCRL